jgi:hypothetical protein
MKGFAVTHFATPSLKIVSLWLASIFCAFFSVLVYVYGYNDDYHFIVRANHGRLLTFHNEIWEDGRPLMSLLFSGMFRMIASVEQLVWIRVFSIFLVAATVWTLFVILRKSGIAETLAATCALAAILTPPFGVLAAWAGGGPHNLLANLLALWAAVIFQQNIINGNLWNWRWPVGVLLLMSAYYFYQVSSVFFLVGLALLNWQRVPDRKTITGFVTANLLFFFGGLFYILSVRWWLVEGEGRLGMQFDLIEKLRFAIFDMLKPALLSWAGFLGNPAEWFFGALMLILFAAGVIANLPNKALPALFWRVCWLASAVGGAIGPFMMAKYTYPVFRSQVSLHVLGITIATFGLAFLLTFTAKRLRANSEKITNYGLISWCLALTICTSVFVWDGIARPNAEEYSKVKKSVQNILDQVPDAMVYKLPPYEVFRLSPYDSVMEYGQISSAHRQVTLGFLQCILRETFLFRTEPDQKDFIRRKIDDIQVYSRQPAGENLAEIDGFAQIIGPPGESVLDPYWGELQIYRYGFVSSPWFGNFDQRQFPYIFHSELGWIYCHPRENPDQGYFFTLIDVPALGTVHTTAEGFPIITRTDNGHHLQIDFQLSPQAWYFDFNAGEHVFIKYHFHQTD